MSGSGKAATLPLTEIDYDSLMAVIRMAIDVAEGRCQPAIAPGDGVGSFEIMPLSRGGPSLASAAAVAASCGLRPKGFLTELASRPGRVVHGWGAVMLREKSPGSIAAEPAMQARLAGVILLAESSPSGGGPAWLSIPWLLVRPESRRMGVGRALVAAAVGRARGLGATRVSIDTLDRWPEAVAFWRGMGCHCVENE